MAIEVTDLPLPDSPTMPTTSPGLTVKDTPSTALVGWPFRRWKITLRFLTSSSTWLRSTGSRVARLLILLVTTLDELMIISSTSGRAPRAETHPAT